MSIVQITVHNVSQMNIILMKIITIHVIPVFQIVKLVIKMMGKNVCLAYQMHIILMLTIIMNIQLIELILPQHRNICLIL